MLGPTSLGNPWRPRHLWRKRVEGIEMGVGGKHEDVDGDEGVQGGEDVGLHVEDSVLGAGG